MLWSHIKPSEHITDIKLPWIPANYGEIAIGEAQDKLRANWEEKYQ